MAPKSARLGLHYSGGTETTTLPESKMKRLLCVTVEIEKTPPPYPEKKLEQKSFLLYFIRRRQPEM